jgi:very-short-patch-repair endonuclease
LLVSYVQPNHPRVAQILQDVRPRLKALVGADAFAGYQGTDPDAIRERAIAMVQALYETIQSYGWGYAEAPASFERFGQKIRLPDMLAEEQLGCCLDLSVLVAACLRAMGLAPLIVLVRGHAFPAVWLEDDGYPHGLTDDVTAIRAELARGGMLAWDSSANVGEPATPFAEAVAIARRHLADDGAFHCALDVKRLQGHFRPLPMRVKAGDALIDPPDSPETHITVHLTAVGEAARPSAPGPLPADVQARFARWSDQLLDLSTRNRLLKLPLRGKAVLPLAVPDAALFEDLLAGGKTFELWPDVDHLPAGADAELAALRQDPQARRQLMLSEMAGGVLHAPCGPAELDRMLTSLERTARTEIEESGAHTLFVGVGTLRWFDGKHKEGNVAPLLLWPVELKFDRTKRLYRLRRTSDDPMPNITLIEKLKRDHAVDLTALANLAADDSGLDVPEMLRLVNDAVRRLPGWEAGHDVVIGLFSFTKFLMWKDLQDNAAVLLHNPVVQHLASRDLGAFHQAVEPVSPEALDARWAERPWPCVVDADATQRAAVASALEGRSFVLQGPPGTGKSQTITNTIAALLAAGKRVLFVAEKDAALKVVKRRLDAVGLGDFCLDLHDPGSKKREVVQALGATYHRGRLAIEVPWAERAGQFEELRARLATLTRALHAPRAIGLSARAIVDRLIALGEAPAFGLSLPQAATLDKARFQAMRDALEEWAPLAAQVEPVAAHPWRQTRPGPFTYRAAEELDAALRLAVDALDRLAAAEPGLDAVLGFAAPRPRPALAALLDALSAVVGGPVPPQAFDPSGWGPLGRRTQAYLDAARAADEAAQALRARWRPGFFEEDWRAVLEAVQRARATNALFAFFGMLGPKKRLQAHAQGALGAPEALERDLRAVLAWQDETRRLAAETRELATLWGTLWPDDAGALTALLARAGQVADQALKLQARGIDWAGAAMRLAARSQQPTEREALAAAIAAVRAPLGDLDRAESALTTLLGGGAPTLWPAADSESHREAFRRAALDWQAELPRFRAWSRHLEGAQTVAAAGLEGLVAAHAAGAVTADVLLRAAERQVLTTVLRAVSDEDPALGRFEAEQHQRYVERFVAMDHEIQQLSRQYVIAALEERLPRAGAAPTDSEPGRLLYELRRQRGHMPVRKLFQAMPNLVARLKPCMLMSPLSIAQYLPADGARFDVVIFDEASQIGTHDAVGAIARGNQVIVVGDSKQLPPTSFFQKRASDDEAPSEDDLVELESVLEEALAKQMPEQMLGWHYRSRHDDLIAFSNRQYYGERLMVFPAARRFVSGLGVSYHPVEDGHYVSGNGPDARTNPNEARALVRDLVAQLQAHPPGTRTFGVVTFSMAQQTLILDLLREEQAKHPAIAPHFEGPEGVFVKNLENVQGDERDEIYFSICYAPDKDDKMRLHFGPLSMAGGERRLNVAVTRAKCQLRVYAALKPDRIDERRTSAKGASDLRAFLEFAQRQGSDAARHLAQGQPATGELERAVKQALERAGYEVHAEAGTGAYRVALAVVHPDRPGEYLLGIETDGAHYASAATASDRERLRAQVLGSLGWRLHRVWALEWFHAPEDALNRLKAALETARTAPPPAPPAPPVTPPAPSVAIAPEPGAVATLLAPTPVVTYPVAALAPTGLDSEAFFAPMATSGLREALAHVVATEGPVHSDLAFRRVMATYGINRLTDRVRRRLQAEAEHLSGSGRLSARAAFFWPAEADPAAFSLIRGAGDDGSVRDAEHLPPEEVASAAAWVLQSALSTSKDSLLKEVARLFGIMRLGKNVAPHLELGLQVLEARGQCRIEGDVCHWREA